ncbi:BON domain-containing protein [Edaphobacter aggregans]|uniref:BON domain-containing protein n=1 Tax=Edaphobacter aggregans TaxID=570835 RepID=UPI000A01C495|nr:BON domain-containing protein [Edaphobacter aggregans]
MISKHWKHAASAATLVVCLAAAAPGAMAQAPDNSAHNKNQDNQTQSADTQSNTKSDRDITAKIRKEIMANKDLSTYAHNVKIVTKNGAVTLKGPVKSDDEKAKVAEIAANVVSADKVTNEITIAK